MNEVTTQIMERLDLLAAKLGVTAEHMWAVLTTQGYIAGAYGVAYVVIGILGFVGGAVAAVKGLSHIGDCDENELLGFLGLIGGVGLMALSAVLAGSGLDNTRYLFNPEYFALKEITGFLR